MILSVDLKHKHITYGLRLWKRIVATNEIVSTYTQEDIDTHVLGCVLIGMFREDESSETIRDKTIDMIPTIFKQLNYNIIVDG